MKTHEFLWRLSACVMIAAVSGCGLGGGREKDQAASGDPEADQRAELRVGSEDGKKTGQNAPRTLYERLGGQKTIEALVDDMTQRVMADPRVNFERREVKSSWLGGHYKPWQPTDPNIAAFKQHMIEFLTLAAGGPAEYTGRDMRSVHKGMKVSNNEFDAMVGDIKTSMDRLGLGGTQKRDLLAGIETTRKGIGEEQ